MKTISKLIFILLIIQNTIFGQSIETEDLQKSQFKYIEVDFTQSSGKLEVISSKSRIGFFRIKGDLLISNRQILNFKNYLEMLDFMDNLGFEAIINFNAENGRTNRFLLKRKNLL